VTRASRCGKPSANRDYIAIVSIRYIAPMRAKRPVAEISDPVGTIDAIVRAAARVLAT